MTNQELQMANRYIEENCEIDSDEYKILHSETQCVSMIHTYLLDKLNNRNKMTSEDISNKFINFLGEKRVKELWDEQKRDLEQAHIEEFKNVNGQTEYGIFWADDDLPF